jgi:hypothetical protein
MDNCGAHSLKRELRENTAVRAFGIDLQQVESLMCQMIENLIE